MQNDCRTIAIAENDKKQLKFLKIILRHIIYLPTHKREYGLSMKILISNEVLVAVYHNKHEKLKMNCRKLVKHFC